MTDTIIRRLICEADGCKNEATTFSIGMCQFRCKQHPENCERRIYSIGKIEHLGMRYCDVVFSNTQGYYLDYGKKRVVVECGIDGIWRAI